MKKIYKIPKNQLALIIVFGFVCEFYLIDKTTQCYSNCATLELIAIIFPFLIIFYVFGWRNCNIKNKS